jgi:hypothetical protein
LNNARKNLKPVTPSNSNNFAKKLSISTKTSSSKEFQALRNSIEKQLIHKFKPPTASIGSSNPPSLNTSFTERQSMLNEKLGLNRMSRPLETDLKSINPPNPNQMMTSNSNLKRAQSVNSTNSSKMLDNNSNQCSMSSFSSTTSLNDRINQDQVRNLIKRKSYDELENNSQSNQPQNNCTPVVKLNSKLVDLEFKNELERLFSSSKPIYAENRNDTINHANSVEILPSIRDAETALVKRPIFKSTLELGKLESKSSKSVTRNRIILKANSTTTPSSAHVENVGKLPDEKESELKIDLLSDTSYSSSIPTLPISSSSSSLMSAVSLPSISVSNAAPVIAKHNEIEEKVFKMHVNGELVEPQFEICDVATLKTDEQDMFFRYSNAESALYNKKKSQTGLSIMKSVETQTEMKVITQIYVKPPGPTKMEAPVYKKAKRIKKDLSKKAPNDESEIFKYEDLFGTESSVTGGEHQRTSMFVKLTFDSENSTFVNMNSALFKKEAFKCERINEDSTLDDLSNLSQVYAEIRHYENEDYRYYENDEELADAERIATSNYGLKSLRSMKKNDNNSSPVVDLFSSVYYPTILHNGEKVVKYVKNERKSVLTSNEDNFVNNLIMNNIFKGPNENNFNRVGPVVGQDETLRDAENMSDIESEADLDQWADITNYEYQKRNDREGEEANYGDNACASSFRSEESKKNKMMPVGRGGDSERPAKNSFVNNYSNDNESNNINNKKKKSTSNIILALDKYNKIRMIDNDKKNKNVDSYNNKSSNNEKSKNFQVFDQNEDTAASRVVSQFKKIKRVDHNNEHSGHSSSTIETTTTTTTTNNSGSIDLERFYLFKNDDSSKNNNININNSSKIEKSLNFLKCGDTSSPLMRVENSSINNNNSHASKNNNHSNKQPMIAREDSSRKKNHHYIEEIQKSKKNKNINNNSSSGRNSNLSLLSLSSTTTATSISKTLPLYAFLNERKQNTNNNNHIDNKVAKVKSLLNNNNSQNSSELIIETTKGENKRKKSSSSKVERVDFSNTNRSSTAKSSKTEKKMDARAVNNEQLEEEGEDEECTQHSEQRDTEVVYNNASFQQELEMLNRNEKNNFNDNRLRANSIDSLDNEGNDQEGFTVECKQFTIATHNADYDIDVDINVSKIEELNSPMKRAMNLRFENFVFFLAYWFGSL